LFATTAPFLPKLTGAGFFQPLTSPTLQLDCTDLPIGQPAATLLGRIAVPLQPSFAEEAA
jgi:hypothetical protein